VRIGLITPTDIGVSANAGWHQITAGIRWLLRAAIPEATFVTLSMLDDRAEDWRAAAACDMVVLCGNPRFSMSEGAAFWENGIWERLLELHQVGIRVLDAWAGATFPHSEEPRSVDDMAAAIAAFPGRARCLEVAKKLPLHITRDATMQRIYELAGVKSVLLPCSSWWAAREYGVAPGPKDWDVLLAHRLDQGWFPDALRAVARRMTWPRIIAPTWADYDWARLNGFKPELITDPASLLRVFARTQRLFTLRVHAAIPAASVGAAVAIAAIDSRVTTCEPFGLTSVRFTELAKWEPTFSTPAPPDDEAVIETVKGVLC